MIGLTVGDGIAIFGVCGTIIVTTIGLYRVIWAPKRNGKSSGNSTNYTVEYVSKALHDTALKDLNEKIDIMIENLKSDVEDIKQNQGKIFGLITTFSGTVKEIEGFIKGQQSAAGS